MVQEGCPYVPAACPAQLTSERAQHEPLARRRRHAAARREGDRAAQTAYRSGMVFRGKLDIPVIDQNVTTPSTSSTCTTRTSRSPRGSGPESTTAGHRTRSSGFATDARPGTPQFDQTPQAFLALDQWLENIKAHPERSVTKNKLADAVDLASRRTARCWRRRRLERILDDRPTVPARTSSRSTRLADRLEASRKRSSSAGGSRSRALRRGVYGAWEPTDAEVARLQEIFPDRRLRLQADAGLPPGPARETTTTTASRRGGRSGCPASGHLNR